MLGRHHLTLSVGTVALVVLPLFSLSPIATLLALIGTAIGSLIPDADSPDAAIFHAEVKGLGDGFAGLLNVPAVLFPPFGYVTKYLIYKPAVVFYDAVVFEAYDIRERHRGFSHSVLGLGTMTVLTAVYLLPVLYVLNLLWFAGVAVFLVGYLAGAILHLIEDSCTKTGIQWNFPFQDWQASGELTTSARPEDVRYQRGFLTVIGAGAAGAFFLPATVRRVPAVAFSGLGLMTAVLLWAGFAKGIAKCSISTN